MSAVSWWEDELTPDERRELLEEFMPNGKWEGSTEFRQSKLREMYEENGEAL